MSQDLKVLEEKIGYTFTDFNLLRQAMIHSSYANEKHLPKYKCNNYLIPNEMELGKIISGDQTLEEKAQELLHGGVENVIVTLGKQGAYLKNRKYSLYFPSAPFHAVDTTGGADSFISALAVALSEDKDLIYAVIYAMYAAGITVTRYGVQEAMPDKNTVGIYREEIDARYHRMMKQISG